MKKIISLILALCIISGLWIMLVSAEESISANKAELLFSLGCIDSELKYTLLENTEITREKFAKILSDVAKLDTDKKEVFADVSETNPYINAISAVSRHKIMMGDGSGNFNPGKSVSELDAMVSILRLLGYEEYSYHNGGYPAGYYVSARKTGLLNKVGEITTAPIKGNKLSVLLMNMLDEHMYTISSVDGNSYEKELTEKSFLSMYYGIGKVTGVVTGNTGTLLNRKKETGGIIIGDKFLSVEDSSYDTLIGMQCSAYFDEESGNLIYIEGTDKNNIQIISSDEIVSVKGNSVTYELSEGRDKTVTFPWDAYILYNGRFLNHYTQEVILGIETGEIKLIDNDSDGKTEVVSILSYENRIIDKVNSEDEIITFKYGAATLGKEDLKDVPILNGDGKTKLSWLHEWESLDILKDDEGKVISIYTSGQLERKEAVEIVLDPYDGYIAFSDGTTAKIHRKAVDRFRTLELNTVNAFSFDIYGKVVAFTENELDKICVLIGSGETNDYEPELMIKYYTEAGEIIQIKLEGIIKLNDVSRKLSVASDYEAVKTALSDAKGGMVEIKTAPDGKIESINIMEIVYDSKGATVHTYFNNYANMICPSTGEQYLMKKSATAFYVPRELSNVTEMDFVVRKVTSVGERNVSLVIYRKLGSTDVEADAVKFVKTSGMDSMGSYDNPMLISRKTKVYVEDEDCVYTKLSYWHGGGEYTALVKDESIISHIDEGDVAWIDVDEGEIMGAVKYFDYSENQSFPPETTAPKGFTASRRMNRGYVNKAFEDCYELAIPFSTTSNGVTTESEMLEYHRYPIYGYVFDSTKTNKVRKATAADFIGKSADPVNYSNVFVHISYTTDYMAVVYK